jgi:hypothetical protein
MQTGTVAIKSTSAKEKVKSIILWFRYGVIALLDYYLFVFLPFCLCALPNCYKHRPIYPLRKIWRIKSIQLCIYLAKIRTLCVTFYCINQIGLAFYLKRQYFARNLSCAQVCGNFLKHKKLTLFWNLAFCKLALSLPEREVSMLGSASTKITKLLRSFLYYI